MRLRSPSPTLTLTITVSPGENSGNLRPMRLISSCSICSITFIALFLLRFLPEFLEQFPLGFVHSAPLQQLGPSQPRAPQRLLQPPALDLRVMPRHQDRGHRASFVHLGPRVLRAVEQAVYERL